MKRHRGLGEPLRHKSLLPKTEALRRIGFEVEHAKCRCGRVLPDGRKKWCSRRCCLKHRSIDHRTPDYIDGRTQPSADAKRRRREGLIRWWIERKREGMDNKPPPGPTRLFEKRMVTFRRLDEDGGILRINNADLNVSLNEATGRHVLPVLLQEGTTIATVWMAGEDVMVDALRVADDRRAPCTEKSHRALRTGTQFAYCPRCGRRLQEERT